MADTTTITNGKAKLPPLSPISPNEDGTPKKKKVVKKKKKPADEGEAPKDGEEVKPKPKRRKPAASANSTQSDGGEQPVAPKKKKKKPATPVAAEDADPTSARSGGSQGEDVTGSKASLISKGTKGGTPRKKKVKKKVVKKSAGGPEDFQDSTLVADLTEIQEDIIAEDDQDTMERKNEPYSPPSGAILRSQPTEKFYIETDRGFKGETKSKFIKRTAEEEAEKAIVVEEPKKTTIAFALSTLRVFKTFCLFCHGILAGLATWHIVMSYILLSFGDIDFLEHYQGLAMPVNSLYYILLVVCTVSVCDRFDISKPNRRFVLQAVTLQNGAISVLLYFAALVVTTTNASLDDKIAQFDDHPVLWNNTQTIRADLQTWSGLNTSRGVLAILGWLVLSIAPTFDRLTKNLEKTDEHIMGDSSEFGKGGSVV